MTTPTDTAKLADEIEALAKDATPTPWFQWPTKDGGRVCAPFPVEGEEPLSIADFDMDQRLDYDTTSCANAALVSRLSQSLPTIVSALRELEAVKAEIATLRELRRVSFIQMLCILRQNGDRMEIYNSAATKIDPYSDEIIQTASIANDSVILERRTALGGNG